MYQVVSKEQARKEYLKYDRLASNIVTKLQNKIAKSGYYENLGQKELTEFRDKLQNANLTYQEQWQLRDMLSTRIDNL